MNTSLHIKHTLVHAWITERRSIALILLVVYLFLFTVIGVGV